MKGIGSPIAVTVWAPEGRDMRDFPIEIFALLRRTSPLGSGNDGPASTVIWFKRCDMSNRTVPIDILFVRIKFFKFSPLWRTWHNCVGICRGRLYHWNAPLMQDNFHKKTVARLRILCYNALMRYNVMIRCIDPVGFPFCHMRHSVHIPEASDTV